MKRISLVFLVLALGWMSTIFYFSSQDGDESKEDSISVGLFVADTFFSNLSEEERLEFAEKIDHPIRKCAHATEYALLGILVYFSLKNPDKRWFWIAWIICILYASSDEIHQLFVPGRSGQISDVCLDSCGALVGILLSTFIQKLKRR